MENAAEQLEKESREGHDKFHWYWSALAGGTLTLLANFLKGIQLTASSKIALKWSLLFVLSSLILSPISNLLSTILVGKVAQSKRNPDRTEEIYKSGRWFAFFRNVFALLSIAVYIFGIALLAYAINNIFLN